jgi:hypothetical protein
MQFGTILRQNFELRFRDCTYWNAECYPGKHKKWSSNVVINHYRKWKIYAHLKHFMCLGKWKFCWHSACRDINSKLNCMTPCIFSYERTTHLEIAHIYGTLGLLSVFRTSNLWSLPRANKCSPPIPQLVFNIYFKPSIYGYVLQVVSSFQDHNPNLKNVWKPQGNSKQGIAKCRLLFTLTNEQQIH